MDFSAILAQVMGTVAESTASGSDISELQQLFQDITTAVPTVDPGSDEITVNEPEDKKSSLFSASTSTGSSSFVGLGSQESQQLQRLMEANAATQRVVQKVTAGADIDYTDFLPGGAHRALRF